MIRMQPTMARARDQLKPSESDRAAATAAPSPSSTGRPRPPERRPTKRQSRIAKKRPLVLAVAQWSAKWTNAGRPQTLVRTKRLLSWAAYIAYQVYAMIRVLIGGRIDAPTFLRRMVVCEDCQSLQKRLVHKPPFVKLYCGSCGCPQWRLAELRRHKNRFRKWECPVGKHERLDEPPEWQAVIDAEGQWVKEPPGETELVPMPPPAEQDFGQPKRPCGGAK